MKTKFPLTLANLKPFAMSLGPSWMRVLSLRLRMEERASPTVIAIIEVVPPVGHPVHHIVDVLGVRNAAAEIIAIITSLDLPRQDLALHNVTDPDVDDVVMTTLAMIRTHTNEIVPAGGIVHLILNLDDVIEEET